MKGIKNIVLGMLKEKPRTRDDYAILYTELIKKHFANHVYGQSAEHLLENIKNLPNYKTVTEESRKLKNGEYYDDGEISIEDFVLIQPSDKAKIAMRAKDILIRTGYANKSVDRIILKKQEKKFGVELFGNPSKYDYENNN